MQRQAVGCRGGSGSSRGARGAVAPAAAPRPRPLTSSSFSRRASVSVQARGSRYDRRRPPPPDLPSLLFDQRIVYLGMPLVPAVTELMVAELLYLEKQGAHLPIEMLINSSGTTRQDGEILAFDAEGVAVTSTMGFIKNPISTVNMGLAVGWSAAVLASGRKGLRKSLPHSLAMLQQPRVPPTGARQAIEVAIKWKEVLGFKRELLRCLSLATGWPVDKLDADMQRPLYMRPEDALEYGVIDEIIQPNRRKAAAAAAWWVKSGKAEANGRLEQWREAVELQEEYLMRDSFRAARAQALREAYRDVTSKALEATDAPGAWEERAAVLKEKLPPDAFMPGGGDGRDLTLRLPFTREALRLSILQAEQRYSRRAVERQLKAGRVKVPERWQQEIEALSAEDEAELAASVPAEKRLTIEQVDFKALVGKVDAMGEEEFASVDLDALIAEYAKPGALSGSGARR